MNVGQEITEMNYYIPRIEKDQYKGVAVEKAWDDLAHACKSRTECTI